MAERKRVLHCWHDGPSIVEWMEANPDADIDEYVSSTCMLERDHEGPHEFTPDDQIGISFAPADPKASPHD
jgi:hypothetical protein